MADVLNRSTLEYLRSVHSPSYPTAQWIVNPDLVAVSGVPVRYWKLSGDTVEEMTQPEKDAVDLAALPARKAVRFAEVDARTQALLAAGVEFPASSGDFYSLTSERLKQFDLMRDADSYPFNWDSVTNEAALSVTDATQAATLLSAAATRVMAIQAGGTTVKGQIRAAADQAALDVIVDPR